MTSILSFEFKTPNGFNNRICAAGLTWIVDGQIAETRCDFINPECNFAQRNIDLHGITPEDVEQAPNFKTWWTANRERFLSANHLIGYNTSFDFSVLVKSLDAYGFHESGVLVIDVLPLARRAFSHLAQHDLKAICDAIGLRFDHLHIGNASRACAEIYLHLQRQGIDLSQPLTRIALECRSRCRISSATHRELPKDELYELKQLLSQISGNGAINDLELGYLNHYLTTHPNLSDSAAYRRLQQKLNAIFEDGIVEDIELKDLYQTCIETLASIKISTPA